MKRGGAGTETCNEDDSRVGPFMQSVKRRREAFGPDTSLY